MNKVFFRLYDFFVVDKWEMSFYCDVYMSTVFLVPCFRFLFLVYFVLAGSYVPIRLFPNYILLFISSFLSSFRFLLFVLLYFIYSLTLPSFLLTVLLYST